MECLPKLIRQELLSKTVKIQDSIARFESSMNGWKKAINPIIPDRRWRYYRDYLSGK